MEYFLDGLMNGLFIGTGLVIALWAFMPDMREMRAKLRTQRATGVPGYCTCDRPCMTNCPKG